MQRHHFAEKVPYSQSYGFSSSHVWKWELDHKEGWAQKNWSFQILVLEKTLESPLDCKEIKLVNPKGNQSWIFTGKADAEAETPILWPPDAKNWLIWKDPDAGKDWRQEKGRTEDEMVVAIQYTVVTRIETRVTKTPGETFVSSVQFSCSVVSDSLGPRGLKDTRLPYFLWSGGTRCHDLCFLNVEF